MKMCIVFVALFAVALAVEDKDVTVVRSDSEVLTDGYKFRYITLHHFIDRRVCTELMAILTFVLIKM